MPSNELMFGLANNFLSSIKTRDWALLESILCPDASWSLPGASLLPGHSAGRDAVVKTAQRIVYSGVVFQLHHIFYGTQGVVLLLHSSLAGSIMVFDPYVIIVCTVRESCILSLDTFMSDYEAPMRPAISLL